MTDVDVIETTDVDVIETTDVGVLGLDDIADYYDEDQWVNFRVYQDMS